MKLNADRTQALLAINGELDAPGVEELIRALAMLRAQMTPGVAAYPASNTPTLSHDNPPLLMDNPLPDGSVVLRLGSQGLGWTSWSLPADQVKALRVGLEGAQGHSPASTGANYQH